MSSTNWPLFLLLRLYFCLSVYLIPPSVCLSLFFCSSVSVLSKFIQLLSCLEICEINTNVGRLAHGHGAHWIMITFLGLSCSWGNTLTRLLSARRGGGTSTSPSPWRHSDTQAENTLHTFVCLDTFNVCFVLSACLASTKHVRCVQLHDCKCQHSTVCSLILWWEVFSCLVFAATLVWNKQSYGCRCTDEEYPACTHTSPKRQATPPFGGYKTINPIDIYT